MPVTIRMPTLSPTMEEGRLAKWLIPEGAHVEQGDVIAEIETDKATLEFESPVSGRLDQILASAGTGPIKVDEPIALLMPGDELIAPPPTADLDATLPARNKPTRNRVIASPAARRFAREQNIDLNQITGSGPDGRVILADLKRAPVKSAVTTHSTPLPRHETAVRLQSDGTQPLLKSDAHTDRELPISPMRRNIAKLMSDARRDIPHIYLRRDVDATRLLDLRAEANSALSQRNAHLTINDFVVKASAMALQQTPKMRRIWADDRIVELASSSLSVAIAIDAGLISPVIQDPSQKAITQVSKEVKELRNVAANGKMHSNAPHTVSLTVSNLGPHGIESFDAIITPPQSAVLAVGAITIRAVPAANGTIIQAPVMSLTLGLDHRVLDGAEGAAFLAHVVDLLERPGALLV